MPARASVIALDVNQTLSDMSPLAERLERIGAPSGLLETWFAGTLRDGIAMTAAGTYADFATVARATLRGLLAELDTLDRPSDEAADYVLAGMGELPLHPDVRPALERLHRGEIGIVTLTNGSAATTRELLARGGADGYVSQHLSVDDVKRWKPAPEPYRYAAERCQVTASELMLVAVHPWDIHGAKRAGLRAAWVNRQQVPYPEMLEAPDLTCSGFGELADALLRDSPSA